MAGKKVFISYRREDGRFFVDLFYNELIRLGVARGDIFYDKEMIPPGAIFEHHILGALEKAEFVFVLIAEKWMSDKNTARLNEQGDWVRREIETALAQPHTTVVPVLFNVPMPDESLLPASLRPLWKLNAQSLAGERTSFEIELLAKRCGLIHDDKDKEILRLREALDRNLKLSTFESYTEIINGVSFKMIAIKGGEFLMGSPTNEPYRGDYEYQHRVRLSDYYIGETTVTQELWRAVMGTDPKELFFKGRNQNPVECVSWDDCQVFIQKLNELTGKTYQLPTEAQWEYAARAGTTTAYHTGNRINLSQANFNKVQYESKFWMWFQRVFLGRKYREETTPVKTFPPNAWGLYDVHGNVWEWCADWYSEYYYNISPTDNPAGPESGTSRVLRGGSWHDRRYDCRVSIRFNFRPGDWDNFLGFRVSRSLSSSAGN